MGSPIKTRSFLRWVRNDAGFTDCEVDSDCDNVEGTGTDGTYKCGAVFGQDALNGGQTTEVRPSHFSMYWSELSKT